MSSPSNQNLTMQPHLRLLALLALGVAASAANAQVAINNSPRDAAPLTAADASPVAANVQQWVIERGERIDLALLRWAEKAGWAIAWGLPVSWESPARVEFKGDFSAATIEVIEALNQDGKRLRLRIFDKGHFMEVVSDAAL